ncbi:putative hydrolase of the HAD superfamily [Promicromonospora sp. AC04]|uniref:HAD family hydrolase n=1 Tax=Promicromonospora sp. AC04 TaxID=2135723 RepID=UPI000D3BCCBF|nr:HAD-IA family hydrolase [Promicromonospora sp. AC04]PUB29647.1 putative hydrolase of the HAD superfamily [Promicromonospora sp. AC04]
MTTIRHVLFDADGVLQEIRGGFYTSARPLLGERAREILDLASERERPLLASDDDFLPVLADVLRHYDVDVQAADLFAAVWQNIATSAASLDLVRGLRDAGYGVHLGTNQVRRRADYMRAALPYDELFDVKLYSCDLGVAKPEAAFFQKAATRIGAEPGAILFIDDHSPNVESARATGMAAVRWRIDEGHDALLGRLAEYRVTPA